MNKPSNIDDASLTTLDDPEFEELLSDAFKAPEIPRSLLQRLDKGVEAQWGISPRLADTHASKVKRSLFRGARWVRGLPLAAALSLLVLCTVMFSTASPGYAWARVMEALGQQDFVQLEGNGVNRWMAPADGLISENTERSSELVDLNRHIVLRRDRDADSIQRRPVTVRSDRSREQMVLTFLMGAAGGLHSDEFLATAHPVEESWEETDIQGKTYVTLNVHFKADNGETADLQLQLDPETHLPQSVKLSNAGAGPTARLTYPTATATERLAMDFPADIPVVDISDAQATKTVLRPHLPEVSDISSKPVTPEDSAKPDQTETPGTTTVNTEPETPKSPLAGIPAEWRPVAVNQRSTSAAIKAVNKILNNLWQENNVQPVALADDEEMLRRVYLDLAGRTPSVSEVRAYFGDKSPDRYERLVNRLLDSPDHATHLAAMFRTFLIPEGVDLTAFGGVEAFDKWLSEQFQSNRSYDNIVQNLLLAEGRLSHSGPLLFYSAAKLDPDHLAARTARVFLGTRLECAQCHDHPFEPWSQEDFWGFAAFFARISRPQGELEAVSSVMQVRDVSRGEVKMPETDTVVAPKFLNSTEPLVSDKPDERRRRLAKWLTAVDNPYFPRATANRVWAMMFGNGIVNPVDDFGVENAPVSPELLDALAGHLISSGYNLRELFRVVALSQAYRLSSGAESENEDRVDLFAQMNVKMLTAEQIYDCITVASMLEQNAAAGPMDFNIARFGNTSREAFLQQFRTPSGRATEYQGGIPQALTLMNGSLINGATGLSTSGLLKSLEAPFFTNEQRIEVLYFATLSRQPKPVEWELLRSYISEDTSGAELQEGLADILWALLNSAEFTMNH